MNLVIKPEIKYYNRSTTIPLHSPIVYVLDIIDEYAYDC